MHGRLLVDLIAIEVDQNQTCITRKYICMYIYIYIISLYHMYPRKIQASGLLDSHHGARIPFLSHQMSQGSNALATSSGVVEEKP